MKDTQLVMLKPIFRGGIRFAKKGDRLEIFCTLRFSEKQPTYELQLCLVAIRDGRTLSRSYRDFGPFPLSRLSTKIPVNTIKTGRHCREDVEEALTQEVVKLTTLSVSPHPDKPNSLHLKLHIRQNKAQEECVALKEFGDIINCSS